jgi:hypothetical protein
LPRAYLTARACEHILRPRHDTHVRY